MNMWYGDWVGTDALLWAWVSSSCACEVKAREGSTEKETFVKLGILFAVGEAK